MSSFRGTRMHRSRIWRVERWNRKKLVQKLFLFAWKPNQMKAGILSGYFPYTGEGKNRRYTRRSSQLSKLWHILELIGRSDDDIRSTVCTEIQLPQIKVDELPLFVDASISSPGWVRTPVDLRLNFQNNSEQLMSFDISIEHNETDVFMFSGSKQVRCSWFKSSKVTQTTVFSNKFLEFAG